MSVKHLTVLCIKHFRSTHWQTTIDNWRFQDKSNQGKQEPICGGASDRENSVCIVAQFKQIQVIKNGPVKVNKKIAETVF